MATRLGLHITPGSRNGYGPVAAAAPAVVLSIGDGAPLREAWEKSQGRTITIYRDMKVYEHGNAPPGFPQMTEAQARTAADDYWPRLRAEYEANPADYYQPTNEIAGGLNDPEGTPAFEEAMRSVRNLIAFETRLMELAEAAGDRFKLAVASLSGGTPGSFELWKRIFVPLIRRAGEGGHIYSRHAYGPGLLTAPGPVPTDGNAGRPFEEALYLRQQGINTPMVITEAGPNAGYQFPGVGQFMEDVKRYDHLCQQHDNIWGFCCWTYGNWRDGKPNIERASNELAAYLRQQGGAVKPQYPAVAVPASGTGADEPGAGPRSTQKQVGRQIIALDPPADATQVRFKISRRAGDRWENLHKVKLPLEGEMRLEIVFLKKQELTESAGAAAEEEDQRERSARSSAIVTRFVTATAGLNMRAGPSQENVVLGTLPFGTEVRVLEDYGPWVRVLAGRRTGFVSVDYLSSAEPARTTADPPEDLDGFHFTVWPTVQKRVNQHFGENPDVYEQFGLPGHEGIDLGSPLDTPYFCVAPGEVIWVSNKRRSSNEPSAYGWHVIIDHGNGYSTLYAHARPDVPVKVGDRLEAGDVVAFSGDTGFSSGPHLHLTLKKANFNLSGWPAGYIDPWPFLRALAE